VTPKHFLEWRAGAQSFDDLALVEDFPSISPVRANLSGLKAQEHPQICSRCSG